MKRVLLISLLACFLSACEKQEAKAPPPEAAPPPAVEKKTASAEQPPVAAPGSYADVVERAGPAVVTIRAAKRSRAPQQHPFFNDPRFRDFFGGIFPVRERALQGYRWAWARESSYHRTAPS